MTLHELRLDQVRVHHILQLPQAQLLHEAALDGAPFGAQAGDGGQAPVSARSQGACVVSRARFRLLLAQTCTSRSTYPFSCVVSHTTVCKVYLGSATTKLQAWSRMEAGCVSSPVHCAVAAQRCTVSKRNLRKRGRHQQTRAPRHSHSPRARASATESAASSSPSGLRRPDLGRLRRASPTTALFPADSTAAGRDLAAGGFVLPAVQQWSSDVTLSTRQLAAVKPRESPSWDATGWGTGLMPRSTSQRHLQPK